MRETEGKFCGKDLSMEMSLFSVRKFCGNEENWGKILPEKNTGMNMSLFLYGNSAEMRETEGNSAGKKQRHGNEIISVWNSAEMRETEGRSCTMYSDIFIYVSLIGNGTWKNVCQQQI